MERTRTTIKYYRAMLWKGYFDKGGEILNYFKYLIIFTGVATGDIKLTLILGLIWGVLSIVIGKLWYRHGLIVAEQEVKNQFDLFCRELRNRKV